MRREDGRTSEAPAEIAFSFGENQSARDLIGEPGLRAGLIGELANYR
jgi:hypothetical protein